MTEKQILSLIFPYNIDEFIEDFLTLKNSSNVRPTQHFGNKFVNYYTLQERLHTISNKRFSFYQFIKNIDEYSQKNWIQNAIKKKFPNFSDLNKEQKIRALYAVYSYSAKLPTIFKPVIVRNFLLYCQQKYGRRNSMLDFTMGWGGRLVGCASLNIPHYIGIDSNTHLQEPYQQMTMELAKYSITQTTLFFTDALQVNYSELTYDMVLTSPPYYNKEIYRTTKGLTTKKSKEDWNTFYREIISKTFTYLQKDGLYCLNIPSYIYEDIVAPLLGECNEKVELHINRYNHDKDIDRKYTEWIYIWKKPVASAKASL